MPEGQTEIYYLMAPNREAAEASPYYEVFREKKYEVLFLYAPHDEFVMDHLREFDKKRLVAAEKADVKLDKEASGLSEEEARLLANFIKERLGDRVNEVKTSKRLVGSPAVVVDSDTHITSSMRRMMKMMNRDKEGGAGMFESKPNLEINPEHAMMGRLNAMRVSNAELAGEVAEQIFDNALVAAGLLEDPRAMLGRLNGLLEKLLAK
jgi:molecular chaperone HtpG